ncbi:MAG: glycosyltransferase family 2 protein [Actinobacteria bacterium]|nr:MAG: glycosyltransferase family 2 protein [Actinomycetota bacterium]
MTHDWFLAPEPTGTGDARATLTFSVLIAAYNVAGVITGAIESALAQTLTPHEVIVCDDGSTDDLGRALEPYAGRITVIRQDNGGEGSAKNAAARAASGQFLAILDADDEYLPGRLEALSQLAVSRPDLDILTSDAYLEVDGRRVRRCYTDAWRFDVGDQRAAILDRNFIFGHVAVRRESFLAVGGFDEEIRWTTDWDCWIRMILDGSRAGCLTAPLATYRVRETSLSSARRELVAGRIQTLEKALKRSDLSTDERAIAERSLGRNRRELSLLELRRSLREGRGDARARAIAVARDRDLPGRVRVKAVAAAMLPRLARRREHRSSGDAWAGAGGTRVTRT